MSNKPPEEIRQTMKFTKPDGAFQIAQVGEHNQCLFLGSNPVIESTDDKIKVYTRKQLS